MSKVDEELTRRFHRAERPVGSDELFEGLARRRRRRRTLQRVQAGALAIAVLAATGGGFVALSTAFRNEPAEGPGGSEGRIVFGRLQLGLSSDGSSSSRGFGIWSMAADGSDLRPVFTAGGSATTPAWSPDGSRIAFLDDDHDAPLLGNLRLLTSEPDGSDVTVIAEGLMDPLVRAVAWSPDATRIAVLDTEEHDLGALDEFGLPRSEIAVFTLDGTRERLVDTPGTAGGFAWSPDGRGFTVTRIDEDGGIDLVRVDLDGRIIGLLAEDVSPYSPAWSPDGSRVAFIREEPPTDEPDVRSGDVWTVRADGTGEERVTRDGSRKTSLDWTADGERIIYATQAPDRCDTVSIRPDGSDRTVVADRSTMGGCAQEIDSLPIGLSHTPPGPSASPEPSPEPKGRDIGLGFNLCEVARRDDIDWFGEGAYGAAWTGTRVTGEGRCGNENTDSIVAADLDGDEIADVWSPIDECIDCRPWAATDLDGNGTEELIVMLLADLEPTFGFYFAVPDGLPRSSGLYPIPLAGPGAPGVDLRSDRIVTIQAGASEEGVSGNAIRCEGYPENPVLVLARWVKDEGAGTVQYHGARLGLEASDDLVDAHFVVVDTFTPTASSEDFGGDGRACGVDFNPWN